MAAVGALTGWARFSLLGLTPERDRRRIEQLDRAHEARLRVLEAKVNGRK